MFTNIEELVSQADARGKKIYELMLEQECEVSGKTQTEVTTQMAAQYEVMKQAIAQGRAGVHSHSGLSGGDGKKLNDYIARGTYLTDETFLKSICYAVATNETNAAMGRVCATPTAGSSGVLPAVLVAAQEKFDKTDEEMVPYLFTAGAIGYVFANNASISGAAGGCQAEVGVASAMAAAALTELAGGSPSQAAHAMAIAIKNMMGLVCDPVAGLVEVPCVKRNAAGAANAFAAAEMALAGVESRIPWDEVIAAMDKVGRAIPVSLRETAGGGLATTKTGKRWKKQLEQG